jgi:anthranilate phosphoribosyltransferase
VSTTEPPPAWFSETLATLLDRRDLDGPAMRRVMEHFISGSCAETEMAALLVALRAKGETTAELAAAAAVLRERMVVLDTGRPGVLDTCGTGGDGAGTFNISTATAPAEAAAPTSSRRWASSWAAGPRTPAAAWTGPGWPSAWRRASTRR